MILVMLVKMLVLLVIIPIVQIYIIEAIMLALEQLILGRLILITLGIALVS